MSAARRLLAAPLWVHAAGLALVLCIVLPIVGATGQFSADEGAAATQAIRLERGDGWTMADPFPAADPTGEAFPFELSSRNGAKFAPFAKHATYAVLLAAAFRVAGRLGMIALSILGTVVAAWLAGRFSRALDDKLAVVTLWTVGLASPLFFDSYVVIAHTLGAACAIGAVFCAWRMLDGQVRAGSLVTIVALIAVGTLLRTEMVIFAVGLAAGVVVLRYRRRVPWLLAAAPLAGAACGFAIDALLARTVMGGSGMVTPALAQTTGGAVASRVFAFVVTWLLPSYSLGAEAAVLLVAVVTGVVAAHIACTRPDEHQGIRVFALTAAVAGVVRLGLGPGPVPGLLVALPLLPIGVIALRVRWPLHEAAHFALVVVGVFAVGVIATQYRTGGSGEWGGRYFALAIPVVVPVVLWAGQGVIGRLDNRTAHIAVLAVMTLSLALSTLAVVTVRHFHDESNALATAVDRVTHAQPADDGGSPVVVASDGAAARFAFDVVDRTRWLTVSDTRLATYADRLRQLSIDRFTFVGRDEDDLRLLEPAYQVTSVVRPSGDWLVATMAAR